MAAPTHPEFLGGLHTSACAPPTRTAMDATGSGRWGLLNDPSRALRHPDREQDSLSDLLHPVGVAVRQPRLGSPAVPQDCRPRSLPRQPQAWGMQDITGEGCRFPEVFRPFVYSPCHPCAKPGILVACSAPHRSLSRAAVAPPRCIPRPLRPKDSSPAEDRRGGFPPIPSLRFVAQRICGTTCGWLRTT
jgi:hypothetical protein